MFSVTRNGANRSVVRAVQALFKSQRTDEIGGSLDASIASNNDLKSNQNLNTIRRSPERL